MVRVAWDALFASLLSLEAVRGNRERELANVGEMMKQFFNLKKKRTIVQCAIVPLVQCTEFVSVCK